MLGKNNVILNKEIARQFIALADAISRGEADLSAQQALLTPDFVLHTPGEDKPVGFEGFKKMSQGFTSGFPNYWHTLEDQIAEGDKVVNRISWSGVHSGMFHGIAPTKKPVTMSIINIMRFEDEEIAEMWRLSDMAGLMKQITT